MPKYIREPKYQTVKRSCRKLVIIYHNIYNNILLTELLLIKRNKISSHKVPHQPQGKQ